MVLKSREKNDELYSEWGYCYHIIPRVWFGELPDLTITDEMKSKKQVWGSNYIKYVSAYENWVVEVNLFGEDLKFRQDGVIWIICKDLDKSLKILNAFLSIFTLFLTIPTFPVDPINFRVYGIKIRDGNPMEESKPLKSDFSDYYMSTIYIPKLFFYQFNTIPVALVNEVVDVGNQFDLEDPIIDLVLLWHQAYKIHIQSQHYSAFIICWSIFEIILDFLWEKRILDVRGTTNSRKSFLKNTNQWSASNKIEVLNMIGMIDNNNFDQINKFRKYRNSIAHVPKLQRNVVKDNNEEILDTLREILNNLIFKRKEMIDCLT